MTPSTEVNIPAKSVGDRETMKPWSWLLKHGLKLWWWFPLAIIGTIANTAMAGCAPILLEKVVDDVNKAIPDTSNLVLFSLLILGSQLVRIPLQFLRSASFEMVAQNMERSIREEIFVSLLGKSMTFHNLHPVGDLLSRSTDDVRQVNFMINPGLNMIIGSGAFLLMPFFLAFKYHPSLCLTPGLFILLYAVATYRHLRVLSPVSETIRALFGRINVRLSETLDGIETVKGGAREKYEAEIFEDNMKDHRHQVVRQGDIEARFIPMLLLALISGTGLMHALWLQRQGDITLGGVVGYFSILMLFEFPAFASIFAYSYFTTGLAGARRILEIINRRDALQNSDDGHTGKLRGAIEFKEVGFSYPDGKAVLSNASFSLEPGKTVAIVGQTGTGKTTMARLINRTFDVTAGAVILDGVDVRKWDMAALRRQISFIEQDVFLFSKTIFANIAFGRPDATADEVHHAARQAQAHDFIESFADGYDTLIGERGVTLSGGQRQRLALARAFLTRPGLLILDDSTSAIDSATEDQIQRAIFNITEDVTTVIITHRLSQIRWADLILVLKDGRIAASGSHDDLMASSEAYRNIFARGD
jgi:ATP-binding cassette subfamily B protein